MDWPQPIRRYVNWKTPPAWLRDSETGKAIPPMAGGSPFRIPNKTTDALQDLAEPDVVDFHILAGGYDRTGVVTGCAVTAQGTPDMTVAVAANCTCKRNTSYSGLWKCNYRCGRWQQPPF